MIGLLEEHVRNPGDLVTKARVYNEAMAKTGNVTALKLIHICVDYSTKMETILAEMRALFDARNHFFRGSPVPLKKVPDLSEFPNLPPMEVLQNLQTPTILRTNQESAETGERQAPGFDAKTAEVGRAQLEVPTPAPIPAPTPETPASVLMDDSKTPPLPADPAPTIPSPSAASPAPANPGAKTSLVVPPLSETTKVYMESVRRQAAFIHTLEFQELLN